MLSGTKYQPQNGEQAPKADKQLVAHVPISGRPRTISLYKSTATISRLKVDTKIRSKTELGSSKSHAPGVTRRKFEKFTHGVNYSFFFFF